METTAPRYERQDIPEGRSLISLFSDLWRETSALVHDEAELAKAEISEKVSQVGSGAVEMAVGGLIVFAGFIVLLFAAVNGLAMILPPEHAQWLAPLIVGLAVMMMGFVALAHGKHEMSAESLTPHRSIDSLRRDGQLVKEHVS
jgi:hypothetical protein